MLATTSWAARLRREVAGEVLLDFASRGRYATDASIYQVEPLGVVLPRQIDDVLATIAIAREAEIPVLPRGAGTSQGGQTVNRALVIDCSKYLRRVLDIDPAARTARVEPGLVLNDLNQTLRQHGLFFPVDPSTHARCTIGGMAGNNSCGSKSIRYGLMADNVTAIDAILADGTQYRFAAFPDNLGSDVPTHIAELIQRLRALGGREADEIAGRFPRLLRRVGGYNIDVLTPSARASGRANLARLLVGSEGTLCFSTAIELTLARIKPRRALGICQFPTFRAAMEAVRHIVALDPEAVELIDRTMIDLGLSIPIYRRTIERMLIGQPESLLLVEFHGEQDAPLERKLDELEALMADLGYPAAVARATDTGFQAAIAEVREAGLNIMMSMKGDRKPVSFIEDCAVGLDELAEYTERLTDVFERYGTSGTWYAHASVGCLHVRPVLSMKDPADITAMRAIAEECFALVREYKGSHSGEHGDGIVRSEFHEPIFGSRIVRAFEEVKASFDPHGLFNPNRIVHPPRMDDRWLFRYPPGYGPLPFTPKLDWSQHPGRLLGAVEMCNNNGMCRATSVGVMCPSYRVTRDEEHVTRGRANTLRLALTGQLGADGVASDALADAMKLCVSCKACRRECPTGVDMARMKIEVLAARAERHGVGTRERLIAELPRAGRWLAQGAPFSNLRNHVSLLRSLGDRHFGIAAARPLPAWRHDWFRDQEAAAIRPAAARGEVLLLADTFNRYFEPENLRAALLVLAKSGYRPVMPGRAARPLCCGRTYLAAGMIEPARKEARRLLAAMDDSRPVIGLEPSCLLTLRDELPALLPGAAADQLASRAMLLSEFLEREQPPLPLKPLSAPSHSVAPVHSVAHVHGHCHQKSFGAFPAAIAALKRVPQLEVRPIAASCCGMAGAFGYQSETLDISRAMAEQGLLPAVRTAAADDLIVADGTSCRHQIRDLAGRSAVHSVRVLAAALQ